MNAAAERGGAPAANADAGGWLVVEPEAGDPVVRVPVLLAGGGFVLAGATGRDGARVGAPAGMGALRRMRPGTGVLMRGIEEGPAGAARKGTAPRNGGAWLDGRAKAR